MDELQGRRLAKQASTSLLDRPRAAAQHIGQTVQAVLDSVEEIRQAITGLVVSALENEGLKPTRSDLEKLHPLFEQILERHGKLLVGVGFVAAPGLLQDAEEWLEWRMGARGGYSRLEVALDATALSNYDYVHAAWFEAPKAGSACSVVGPYVDFGGTNAYVVTLTVPVHVHGDFIGVAGADLLVDQVESLLRKLTHTVGLAASIVTDDGRVLASGIPRQAPGTRLRDLNLTVSDGDWAGPGLLAFRCEGLPWKLVVLTQTNI